MSLLRDIQNAAIDANMDISVILRKCKVLAARLGNEAFKKWVDQELNGYQNKDTLPNYRILDVNSKGDFIGPAESLKNADIPLACIPKKFREGLDKSYCIQPIAAYESLLKTADGDNLQEQWRADLVAIVGRNIYKNANCLSAWKLIPNASIVSLVEGVRNRILSFVLEIENEAPDAGEASPTTQPISQEKVTQVFNTTIYGNVGNIAEGNQQVTQQVTQTATINVSQNDLESLKKYLLSIGIPRNEIKNLREAINEDSAEEVRKTKSLGLKVLNWIGSIATKIAKGTVSVAQKLSINLITQAILTYYGIK